MLLATRRHRLDLVRAMLRNADCVAAIRLEGMWPGVLNVAAQAGHGSVPVFCAIAQHPCVPSGVDPRDHVFRLMHVAIAAGDDPEPVALLLATVCTPAVFRMELVQASQLGRLRQVQVLLADGRADPGAAANMALYYACRHNHVDVVRVLLADPRTGLNQACLETAVENGCVDVLRTLLADARTDHTLLGLVDTLFLTAISAQPLNAHVWRVLLQDGRANPAVENHLAVWVAATDLPEMLDECLADPRLDPGADDSVVLAAACRDGNLAVVQKLATHPQVDVSARNCGAFYHAGKAGADAIMAVLLSHNQEEGVLQGLLGCVHGGNHVKLTSALLEVRNPFVGENDGLWGRWLVHEATRLDNDQVLALLLQAHGAAFPSRDIKYPKSIDECPPRVWAVWQQFTSWNCRRKAWVQAVVLAAAGVKQIR